MTTPEEQNAAAFLAMNQDDRTRHLFDQATTTSNTLGDTVVEVRRVGGMVTNLEETAGALLQRVSAMEENLRSAAASKLAADETMTEILRMITGLQDDQRTARAGRDTRGNTKQPRVAAPLVFNGDAEKVDQLLADCWLNFQGNTAYESEVSKITYCLSYMKEGSAAIWSNNVVQAMRTGTGEGAYQTWTEFEKAVTTAFKGGAQVEIAQAKMEHLRQDTGTATAFFTVLDSLNKTAGYDETTLIRLLKGGLNQKVVEQIYQGALPTDYAGWKVEATKHDGLRRAFQAMNTTLRSSTSTVHNPRVTQKPAPSTGFQRRSDYRAATTPLGASAGSSTPATTSFHSPAASNTPAPMDIDRTASRPSATKPIPTCYRCGKVGHIARNCDQKETPNAQFRAMVADMIKETMNQGFPEDQE